LHNRYGRQPYQVMTCPVKGDKIARAYAVQPILARGLVYAPNLSWADQMISDPCLFPMPKFDDLVDSMTQGLKYLRDTGMAQDDEEVVAEENERAMHRSRRLPPLYPV
jgi:predicted phage terminase large subunit-like protein